MMQLCVEAVGVIAPGLPCWRTAREVLRGERPYEPGAIPRPDASMLPANERRRTVASVRWALTAAQEAMSASGYAPADVATVFASSGGDGETLHGLCEALARPGREISPTRFHNSVHNAPAGYWSIAAGARQASVSLCGYDASFATGLVEAASQVRTGGPAVLLVAYDVPHPQPLHAVRPIALPFAVALLLAAKPGRAALLDCRLSVRPSAAESERAPAWYPSALADNPAARALPLLSMLARDRRECVHLQYHEGLDLLVEPL